MRGHPRLPRKPPPRTRTDWAALLQSTVNDMMDLVHMAARTLPHLRVVITPDCDGEPWLVDPRTDTVYLDGDTTPTACNTALVDAVSALCQHRGIPYPWRRLRVVSTQTEPGLRTGA